MHKLRNQPIKKTYAFKILSFIDHTKDVARVFDCWGGGQTSNNMHYCQQKFSQGGLRSIEQRQPTIERKIKDAAWK